MTPSSLLSVRWSIDERIRNIREGENMKTIKTLKKWDSEINMFQKDVRRKVVTPFEAVRYKK